MFSFLIYNPSRIAWVEGRSYKPTLSLNKMACLGAFTLPGAVSGYTVFSISTSRRDYPCKSSSPSAADPHHACCRAQQQAVGRPNQGLPHFLSDRWKDLHSKFIVSASRKLLGKAGLESSYFPLLSRSSLLPLIRNVEYL